MKSILLNLSIFSSLLIVVSCGETSFDSKSKNNSEISTKKAGSNKKSETKLVCQARAFSFENPNNVPESEIEWWSSNVEWNWLELWKKEYPLSIDKLGLGAVVACPDDPDVSDCKNLGGFEEKATDRFGNKYEFSFGVDEKGLIDYSEFSARFSNGQKLEIGGHFDKLPRETLLDKKNVFRNAFDVTLSGNFVYDTKTYVGVLAHCYIDKVR